MGGCSTYLRAVPFIFLLFSLALALPFFRRKKAPNEPASPPRARTRFENIKEILLRTFAPHAGHMQRAPARRRAAPPADFVTRVCWLIFIFITSRIRARYTAFLLVSRETPAAAAGSRGSQRSRSGVRRLFLKWVAFLDPTLDILIDVRQRVSSTALLPSAAAVYSFMAFFTTRDLIYKVKGFGCCNES